MVTFIIRFLNIAIAGLIAGTLFGIWAGYNPKRFTPQTYIEQQQGAIKGLNTLMPLLGLITIILTVTSAFLQKENQSFVISMLIAAGFIVMAGLITKFGNQPINTIVMTWKKNDIPDNWIVMRDKWWSLHILRSFASGIAFLLIVWANLRKD
jgi:hypothetical protein